MENETTKNDGENVTETDAQNVTENTTENQGESQAPADGAQMTLENMTAEVSQIYAGFDPEKHAVNADGTPKKRADGQWANKRGRKPGQTSAATSPSAPTSPAKPAPVAPLSAKKAREGGVITNKQAAHATVKMAVTALGSTIGPEWDFESPEEAQNMIDAVHAYYDANGQVQISPEMMLGFQVFAYAAPRSQHPNTKEKLKSAWDWCKGLFSKLRG